MLPILRHPTSHGTRRWTVLAKAYRTKRDQEVHQGRRSRLDKAVSRIGIDRLVSTGEPIRRRPRRVHHRKRRAHRTARIYRPQTPGPFIQPGRLTGKMELSFPMADEPPRIVASTPTSTQAGRKNKTWAASEARAHAHQPQHGATPRSAGPCVYKEVGKPLETAP